MQTVSSDFSTAYAANHTMHTKLVVYNSSGTGNPVYTFGEDRLISIEIENSLFSGSEPGVGGVSSASIEIQLYPTDASEATVTIPKMALLRPYVRPVSATTTPSDWLSLGYFYVDTRSYNAATGIMTLHGYDGMLKTEGEDGKSYLELYAEKISSTLPNFPRSAVNVLSDICTITGLTLESAASTLLASAPSVEYPNDYTMRNILGYIAASVGANWTIETGSGKLRLVQFCNALNASETATSVGEMMSSLEANDAQKPYGKVIVWYYDDDDQDNAYEASVSGYSESDYATLELDCPWGVQATANYVLTVVQNKVYKPFSADSVHVTPAVELGDQITFGGSHTGGTFVGICNTISRSLDSLCLCDLESQASSEVESEYPYTSSAVAASDKEVKLGGDYYGNSITRQYGFKSVHTSGAYCLLNANTLEFTSAAGEKQLYYDATEGTFVINGKLGAKAVFTDSLYAEMGEISELTVDRLSTSKKIQLHGLGSSTTEDNYILIQDNEIAWVTATPSATEVQATNRYGEALYWSEIPDHYTNGYPYDEDNNRIYATTENDQGPAIMVYTYTTAKKMRALFDSDSSHTPTLIIGAGDSSGHNYAKLYKGSDGVHLDYINSSGTTDTISHSNSEDFWRLNGYGIAPVASLPASPLTDVIYLTPASS